MGNGRHKSATSPRWHTFARPRVTGILKHPSKAPFHCWEKLSAIKLVALIAELSSMVITLFLPSTSVLVMGWAGTSSLPLPRMWLWCDEVSTILILIVFLLDTAAATITCTLIQRYTHSTTTAGARRLDTTRKPWPNGSTTAGVLEAIRGNKIKAPPPNPFIRVAITLLSTAGGNRIVLGVTLSWSLSGGFWDGVVVHWPFAGFRWLLPHDFSYTQHKATPVPSQPELDSSSCWPYSRRSQRILDPITFSLTSALGLNWIREARARIAARGQLMRTSLLLLEQRRPRPVRYRCGKNGLIAVTQSGFSPTYSQL